MVYLDSIKEVYCDDVSGHKTRCEFVSLLANSQVCGNCPLMQTSEKVISILFDSAMSAEESK